QQRLGDAVAAGREYRTKLRTQRELVAPRERVKPLRLHQRTPERTGRCARDAEAYTQSSHAPTLRQQQVIQVAPHILAAWKHRPRRIGLRIRGMLLFIV